ncbi:MAG: hypothetical protein OEM89_09545 [Nitrosopumilus sp.]|nr:hypothetical protein [Nitrosopumilus sp.]
MKWVVLFLIILGLFPAIAYGQEKSDDVDFSWDNFSLTFDTPENYFNEVSRNLAAGSTIYDLGIYIGGMAAYAIFVWHFYRFIARREIIPIDYDKYDSKGRFSPVRITAYIISHILLFPLIIFVWFFVYSMFMFILAKDMPTGVVLLIAISVIGAIRVTSYYKEDLSKDVGKLLPFALLAVFLTSSAFYTGTSNFFSLEDLETKLQEFPQFLSRVIEFVFIIVIIEAILRTLFIVKRKIFPAAEEKLEEQIEEQIDEKIKTRVGIIEKKQRDLEKKIEKETDEIEKKLEKETNEIEKKIGKGNNSNEGIVD